MPLGGGRSNLEANITATGAKDAARDIRDVADAIADLEDRKDVTATITTRDEAIDKIKEIQERLAELADDDTEIGIVARAEALGELGALGDKMRELDEDEVVMNVRLANQGQEQLENLDRMIRNMDGEDVSVLVELRGQVESELEDIRQNLQRLDGQEVTPKVNTSGVRDEFRQMSGQAVESFAEAAGASGPLADSLGNIADAAATADGGLKGMVTAGATIGALSLATYGLNEHLNSVAETQAWRTDQIQGYVDAIREGEDAAEALAERLRDTGKIEFDEFNERFDISDVVSRVGLNFERFSELATGGSRAIREWGDAAVAAGADAGDVEIVMASLTEQHTLYAQGTAIATATEALFRQESDRTADALGRAKNIASEASAARSAAAERTAEKLEQERLAQEAATAAAEQYAATIGSTDWAETEVAGAAKAMGEYNDGLFELANIAANGEAALDSFAESLAVAGGNVNELNLTTDEGRAALADMQTVAASLEPVLVAAFDSSNGSLSAFKGTVAGLREDFIASAESAGLTTEQAVALADAIGLTPDAATTRFELAGAEEAYLKLQLLQGSLDDLPPEVNAQVNALVVAGDYEGALRIIQDHYANNPATIDAIAGDYGPAAAALSALTTEQRQAAIDAIMGADQAGGPLAALTNEQRQAVIDAIRGDLSGAQSALSALTNEQRKALIDAGGGNDTATGWLNRIASGAPDATISAVQGSDNVSGWLANLARPRFVPIHAQSAVAHGGILSGVAQVFAAGGWRLPTSATIQQPVGPAGLVQWAEPTTGGEAFIPLAADKRRRSLQIWQEVGRRLGVAGFDDGGLAGSGVARTLYPFGGAGGAAAAVPIVNVIVEIDGQVVDSRARVVIDGALREVAAEWAAGRRFE